MDTLLAWLFGWQLLMTSVGIFIWRYFQNKNAEQMNVKPDIPDKTCCIKSSLLARIYQDPYLEFLAESIFADNIEMHRDLSSDHLILTVYYHNIGQFKIRIPAQIMSTGNWKKSIANVLQKQLRHQIILKRAERLG